MRLNPFNNTVDKRIIRALEDLATENYGNPFTELARVKIKARELLKQLKNKNKITHIQQWLKTFKYERKYNNDN